MQLAEANKEVLASPCLPERNNEKISDVIGCEESEDNDSNDESTEDSPQKQLVLYNPGDRDTGLEIQPLPDSSNYQMSFSRLPVSKHSSRTSTSIGAFTIQCSRCLHWRLIPTKEKYEKIRERILQEPFYCETAQGWRPDVSCNDPSDISQDGSRLWAMDRPNIAQAPPGWERLLRIRGEGGTRFADVYYVSPSGKRLRSMVEIQKYLLEHPEYASQGVSISQFSFLTPKPLQENYVRKRPVRLTDNVDGDTNSKMPGPLEPEEVRPLSWACPTAGMNLPQSMPDSSNSELPVYRSLIEQPPSKKLAARQSSQLVDDGPDSTIFSLDQHQIKRPHAPADENVHSD